MREFCVAVVLVLLGVAGAPPAAAAPELDEQTREAGLWYVDRLHLDEIHERGITGEGVTIAVIDSGINTQVPELAGTNIEVKGRWCADYESGEVQPADSTDLTISEHGTSVVSMIAGNGTAGDGGTGTRGVAPDASIWFYAGAPATEDGSVTCMPRQPEDSTTDLTLRAPSSMKIDGEAFEFIGDGAWEAEAMAALDAIRNGADIISISVVGGGSPSWEAVVAEAVREGVVLVAGTSNPGDAGGLVSDVPATYNGAVAVNSVDPSAEIISVDGARAEGAPNLAVVAPGVGLLTPNSPTKWSPSISSGNSLAAPIVASIVALGLQHQPEASAHQIVQAMIRTPGSRGFGEPEWSDRRYGYGIVNPKAMLEVEAANLPDENPLFVSDPEDPRCTDSVTGENPASVSECMSWAITPVPEDVWPEETPAPGADEPAPGAHEPAPEQPAATPVWWFIGGGVLLVALIAAGGAAILRSTRSR